MSTGCSVKWYIKHFKTTANQRTARWNLLEKKNHYLWRQISNNKCNCYDSQSTEPVSSMWSGCFIFLLILCNLFIFCRQRLPVWLTVCLFTLHSYVWSLYRVIRKTHESLINFYFNSTSRRRLSQLTLMLIEGLIGQQQLQLLKGLCCLAGATGNANCTFFPLSLTCTLLFHQTPYSVKLQWRSGKDGKQIRDLTSV